MKARYGCDEKELAHYTCYRASHKMTVDGRLDKPAWREAPWSRRFVDLVSGVPGFLDTRMAALWDDGHLYVAFWVGEPNVRAKLAKRDSLVWTENDVEVFIGSARPADQAPRRRTAEALPEQVIKPGVTTVDDLSWRTRERFAEPGVTTAVPEWDGQEISLALEQSAFFLASGVSFPAGRQTAFHLIRFK